MIYLLAITAEGKNYIVLNDDNSLTGTENLEEAMKMLPDFNSYHKADMTWSASATLFWLTFRPKIIQMNSLDDVEKALDGNKMYNLSAMQGYAKGALLKQDYVMDIVKEAPLIDENFNKAKPFYEK